MHKWDDVKLMLSKIVDSVFFRLIATIMLGLKHGESHILREACMAEGTFSITSLNRKLAGALLFTLSHISEESCHKECLFTPQCKSVNYHPDNKQCQLNNGIVGDIDTTLERETGWKHQNTNYSTNMVC